MTVVTILRNTACKALTLVSRIETARRLLRDGHLANESSVSTSIVFPILQALGWDVFDPTEVHPEYAVGARRVDFALLHHGKPAVFIEVKQPGLGLGADQQLFDYAFHTGVPLAVLTDGRTWSVYLPSGFGDYTERRVYLLDLEEREPEESAERLQRYLQRDDVGSEAAFERARLDYQRSRQRREAREAIPSAWYALVEDGDDRLLGALADEVESRSGYRPERDDLHGFLSSLATVAGPPAKSPPRKKNVAHKSAPSPLSSSMLTETHSQIKEAPADSDALGSVGFMLEGQFVSARNGRDVLVRVFQALDRRDPAFLDRFVALPKHGRTRRYLARSPEAVYPKDPSFADPQTVAEIKTGYWVMTNASHGQIRQVCSMAAAEAGLTFGEDLRIRLK